MVTANASDFNRHKGAKMQAHQEFQSFFFASQWFSRFLAEPPS